MKDLANFPEDRPLIIDCFAGGGGASTGIERALGRSPDVAINHSGPALALHQANHPETLHLNSNIWDVDPVEVCQGRSFGLLWASPDCKHFSKAKGGAPKDRNIRDLAWTIVDWAEKVRPDVILMENVEEFRTWGPICDAGRVIKGLEGVTFDQWVKRLRAAGYKLQWRELRGCDYGAPTIRKRFFMVARRDGRRIVWPKPTHGDPKSEAVQTGKLLPWRTAADCIDFNLPCPSIFDSAAEIKKKLGLQAKRPLAENTLARVVRGMQRYVLEAEQPYLVSVAHGNSGGQREYGLNEPKGTVTAKGQSHAFVTPYLSKFNGGATGAPMDGPAPTVTANSYIKRPGGAAPLGMVVPHLMTMRNAQKPFNGADEPAHTITAGGAGLTLVSALLASLKGTTRRMGGVDAPHPTVLAGGGHSALISPVLSYAQHGGRNRDPLDPMHTVTASKKDNNSLIAATMVQTGYSERKGQAPRALDQMKPLGTVVAGGIKHASVAAFLAQHNKARVGINPGRAADLPLSTATATGSRQSVIASYFAKQYGGGDLCPTTDPMHTITVKDRFYHTQAQLSAPPFTEDMEYAAYRVARFLEEHGAWDSRRFVTLEIDGKTYVVVDIGMRMLTPRELFNAQGFPADYVIEGVWHQDGDNWTFESFPKHVQVSCCGNSVCPDLAAALAGANCQHLQQRATQAA